MPMESSEVEGAQGHGEEERAAQQQQVDDQQEQEKTVQEDDDFGDDFDDFEEGGDEEDDFGDFGEAGDADPTPTEQETDSVPIPPSDPLSHLPPIDFQALGSLIDIQESIMPYLQDLFPEMDMKSLNSRDTSLPAPEPLLSDRSASLWSQLVAPPPLQPPNWIRSRIRRLFLVSLGVPVDLDEILPASKQKKLVLPSIHLDTDSPRESTNLSRVRKEDVSSTSLTAAGDKSGDATKKERKKTGAERSNAPSLPNFDMNAAGLLCSTTEVALSNLTDDELKTHIATLDDLNKKAGEVLEYWLKRKDSAVGDKEAFEGVIENLVGFVKKSKQKR